MNEHLRQALEDVPILQPSSGRAGDHHLASTPDTVRWGRLPCADDAPVLVVDDGDIVTIDTVSHEGILEDQGRDPVAVFGDHGVPAAAVLRDAIELASSSIAHDPAADGPHVVTGPIAVRGASAGDVVAVDVLALELRAGYGFVSSRHGRGALPGELPTGSDPSFVFCTVARDGDAFVGVIDAGRGRALRFPLRPFLGVTGVAVAGSCRPHSVPPGPHGGNLDIALLGGGATLYLPAQVDGGLVYVGDPHFAQGDGEVALTAFEAPLRATVRLRVVPGPEARARFGPAPRVTGETADALIPIGLDPDLNEAMRSCVRHALDLLVVGHDIEPAIAYAYLSAAGDFAISQVVDQVKGVHGRIRKADLAGLAR